jgi:hypothetical protein
MPTATTSVFLGFAAAAAFMTSAAGADNVIAGSEALTFDGCGDPAAPPKHPGDDRWCGAYTTTANSTPHGCTTCGMGNHPGQYGSCAGQRARGEDASIKVIVTEAGFHDVTLDPLGTGWCSVMVHQDCPCADPDGCPEDLDSNHVIDIDDLFTVLANWGPCP